MSVFLLDPDTGQIIRDRQGFVRTSGLDAVAQDCRVYLRGRQGEIPTRTDLFLPWLTLLEQPFADSQLAQVVGERGVLTRVGVVRQTTEVSVDRVTRTATVTFSVVVSLDQQRRQLSISEQLQVAL